MSIKPRLVERILAGTKLMEIRKRFSDRWVGGRVVLYASSPQKALVGEATIQSVTKGPPADIWEKFETSIGCSSDEYYTYVGSATMVNAIELAAVIPYVAPISLIQVSHLVQEDLIPPQSFCDLRLDDDESVWAKAVSVASLLHGRFSALSGTSR
jgi:predicted transcriptional regulator